MTDSIIIIENKFDKSPEELLELFPRTNNAESNILNTKNLAAIIEETKNASDFHLCALLNKDHEALDLLSKKITPLAQTIKNPEISLICYQHFYKQLSQELNLDDPFSKYLNTQKIIYLKDEYISFNDFKKKIDDEIAQSTQGFTQKFLNTIQGRKQLNLKKANVKSKYQDYIKNSIKANLIKIDKVFTNNDASKAMLNFSKAICLADNNEKYFEESVISFHKYLKSIKQGQEISRVYLSTINFLVNLYASDKSFELNKELYNLYKTQKNSFNDQEQNILAEMFCNSSSNFTSMWHYSYALFNAKIAYDICKQNSNIHPEIYFNSTYNLATCAYRFYPVESLKYYDEAETLNSNDLELIEDKILTYKDLLAYGYTHVKQGDCEIKINDLIEATFNNINDDQYKKLLNLSFDFVISNKDFIEKYEQIEKSNIEESFLKSKKEELLLLSEAKYNILKENYDKGLDIYHELFQVTNTAYIIPYSISMLGTFIIKTNLYLDEKILNFYANFAKNKPLLKNHFNSTLKFNEFKLYNHHGREKEAIEILEFLNISTSFGEHNNILANYANEIYVSTKFIEGKFKEALEYVKSGKIFDKDSAAKYQILIEKQIDLQKNAPKEEPNDNSEVQDTTNADETSVAIDLLPSNQVIKYINLDQNAIQKNIHNYFQSIKNARKNIITENAGKIVSWKIDEKHSFSEKSENIYKVTGKEDYYATIDSNLNIDSARLEQYKNALSNGLVTRDKGQNGIKFLGKNGFCELKINGGDRLYISKLYKNPDDKYLIVFSKEGNHKTIGRKVNCALKVIKVESESDTSCDFPTVQKELDYEEVFNLYSADDYVNLSGDNNDS